MNLFVFLSGALLMGILVLALVQTNTVLTNKLESYVTLESMRNVPMASNGDGGRFLPEQELFYIKTNYGIQQSCLSALHEIAHTKQWETQNPCFYDYENINSCEQYAENFVKENAWRCEQI